MKTAFVFFVATFPLFGQQSLSLRDAIERALQQNPGIHASKARESAAEDRVRSAKGGYLPQVNYQEMAQRSNNPVFVFSARLTQRQFTEQHFAISSLNRPGFVNNFQSMVTVDQILFDGGRTRNAVQGARVNERIEQQRTKTEELAIMARTSEAYLAVKLGEQALRAAEESVTSAKADLQRAESFRKEGMSTDADVLSIRVHMAAVQQQVIERFTQLEVAKAALNMAMGEREDSAFHLVTPLAGTTYRAAPLADSQRHAIETRPELAQLHGAVEAALLQQKTARSAYLPEVFVRGVFETDRQELLNKGGANWFAGGGLRWNLFNGLRDKARVSESKHLAAAAEADARGAEAHVRFEVRAATLRWQAVKQQLEVANATVAEAEESLRITRDRYENGLNTVTDLLRSETALLTAKTNYLDALFGQHRAAVQLESVRGSLEVGSSLFD